jgi:hypothetical protein
MHGLVILAIMATLISATVIAVVLRRVERSAILSLSLVAIVLAILHPLVFTWIRLPFDGVLRGWVDGPVYHALCVLYAPLTEEPAKLWVLLLPLMARVARTHPTTVAVVIGFGFGTGELWLIASRLSSHTELAGIPWYQLMPFLGERLLACVIHAGLASAAMMMWSRGHGLLVAIGCAMVLHLLVNLPIYLLGPHVFALGATANAIVLTVWILLCATLAGVAVVVSGLPGSGSLAMRLFGMRTCPHCQGSFPAPLVLAINLGTTRMERCPHCRRWGKQPMGHSPHSNGSQ